MPRAFLLLLLLLAACSAPQTANTTNAKTDYWTYQHLVSDTAKRDALYALGNVRQVYLEAEAPLLDTPDQLTAFIAEADQKGIKVVLLFGDNVWIYPEKQAIPLELARRSVAYIEGLKAAGKPAPVGVQFDIEPHALPEWSTNPDPLNTQYLQLLKALNGILSGKVRFTAAMPFWYDDKTATLDGQTRPFNQWVQDFTDQTMLMDYRDRVDWAIDAAQNEVGYAQQTGKKIVIGLEANCYTQPELQPITFCEEGKAALESALGQISSHFAGFSAMDGVAVFTLEAYQKLK